MQWSVRKARLHETDSDCNALHGRSLLVRGRCFDGLGKKWQFLHTRTETGGRRSGFYSTFNPCWAISLHDDTTPNRSRQFFRGNVCWRRRAVIFSIIHGTDSPSILVPRVRMHAVCPCCSKCTWLSNAKVIHLTFSSILAIFLESFEPISFPFEPGSISFHTHRSLLSKRFRKGGTNRFERHF